MMFRTDQMGVYFHWPFCASKCPYCDFNAHVRGDIDQQDWVDAYIRAIEHYAQQLPEKQVVSIFFGGGTPSLMEPQSVAALVNAVQKNWRVSNDIEITLEANPTSVEIEKFEGFRVAGVNRISLGVQAMNDKDLSFLGRGHSHKEALKAIEIAGRVFDRYSFDLIYARPEQTLKAWEEELIYAQQFARGHLSLYQLTIERNTPFYMREKRGDFTIPDDVMGADFYHLTQDVLEDANMPTYEVSNHAAQGQECRHNLVYWHMADYIGIGAGAHGRFHIGGHKYASRDHSAPDIWKKRVFEHGHGSHPFEGLSKEDEFIEALMMGLRLREGISIEALERASGLQFTEMVNQPNLERVLKEGWALREENALRLTREGLLRLNPLIGYLLD